ncbi:MAG TPA: VCBS repeat-containing protein, partial [Gemmata sp.]
YDGANGALVRSFFSFAGFLGGVNVAAGDIDGDGRADVIVGAGAGAPGGHVKVFSGATGAEIYSFFAYGMGFLGGASVAAGDVDGDGRTDFITGSGAGAPSGHVKVFSGRTGLELSSFLAYVGFNGGVRVSAGDLDGDGRAEVLTGTFGAAPHVKVFGPTGQERASFLAFDTARAATVDVAAVDVDGDGLKDVVAAARYGRVPQVRVFRGADFAPVTVPFALDDILGGVEVG